MAGRRIEDPELEARIRAAEEWSAEGNPGSTLPRVDLVALAALVLVACVAAWLWGAPA